METIGIRKVLTKIDGKTNSYRISKKCKITYSHLHNILNKLSHLGLIRSVRKGRERITELTDRGNLAKESMLKLQELGL